MRTVANFFAEHTIWAVFHTVMIAAFSTGFFMAYTAGDLGPLGPILISIGICVMLFAALAEALFLTRQFLAYMSRRYIKNHPVEATQ